MEPRKSIAQPDAEKMTEVLLTSFANKDSVQFIKQFIGEAGIEKFDTYWQREKDSFMHILVKKGYIKTIKKLILHNKNLLLATEYDNKTQLIHTACVYGKYDIAAFLLHQGADIQAKNHLGETPLHLAALGHHITTVNLLLKHGANVGARNNYTKTALGTLLVTGKNYYAAQNLNIITLLIAYGAEISDYQVSSTTLESLKNIINVAPLLRSALKTFPTDFNQLAKALLLEYSKKSGANYATIAKEFSNSIDEDNPNLLLLQLEAESFAERVKSSKSFEPLCRFIASEQFQYCLAPITNPVAHLESILAEKDIHTHLLKQMLDNQDKDSPNPRLANLLATWLLDLKDISDELVEILRCHKDKIDFQSIIRDKNYLHILDPRTPIGRVLWSQRKDIPCSFYAGTCSNLISYLEQHYRIKPQTIIDNLLVIGVKIHKPKGFYSIIKPIESSIPRFYKAPVNTTNINEALLKNLADTQEEELLINEFINGNTAQKFASYWQLNKKFLLLQAVAKRMIKFAEKLFKHDPDLLSATFGENQHFLLHSAAGQNDPALLTFLLKNNTNINCKTLDGCTALSIAAHRGHTEIVDILLANGADVNAVNNLGNASLQVVIRSNVIKKDNFINIFVKLIANGADTTCLLTKSLHKLPIYDVPALHFLLQIKHRHLLQIAQQTYPDNMLELTKALLQAYIDDKMTIHKHIDKAKQFLGILKNCSFDNAKDMAVNLLQQPYMKDSETFKQLCEFICTKEFEYFLIPQKEKPNYNPKNETIEMFYNML